MKTRYDTYHRSIASLGRQSADLTEARDRARPVRTDPHAPSVQPSVLEAFHPDISQAVTLLWGHPEMNQYFERLWLDDGSGTPIAPMRRTRRVDARICGTRSRAAADLSD